MRQLSKYEVQALVVEAMPTWRPLERARYQYHMISPDPEQVLAVLDTYQNPDGGFGHGIEPDFWLPESSPMATSVGLQYLLELDQDERVLERIDKALAYLAQTYDVRRMGWQAVPAKVNDHPHAPWWHYTSGINPHWGNPSMELFGYLLMWHADHGEQSFKDQLDHAERNLLSKAETDLEVHEIYCYLRTYPHLSERRQTRLQAALTRAIKHLLVADPEKWSAYVPKPLDFVAHPRDEHFGISQELLARQLEDTTLKLLAHKTLEPGWTWAPWPGLEPSHTWPQWERDWPVAKAQWQGVLTLKALIQLKDFGWIV